MEYIDKDIERAFGTKTNHTLLGNATSWWQEITSFLEENLWNYDDKPDPHKMVWLQTRFSESWRDEVATHFFTKPILEHFDTEITISKSSDIQRIGEIK